MSSVILPSCQLPIANRITPNATMNAGCTRLYMRPTIGDISIIAIVRGISTMPERVAV